MKKVIDGALYNTDTAREIGTRDNGYLPNDLSYLCETLYRTKSGKYFLHGEGGPQTRYGKWEGNNGTWGEVIRPYSPTDAREWAEEYLTPDDYALEFGEPAEAGDGREVLTLSVSAEAKRKLELLREQTGKSISQIVTDLVAEL